MAAYRLQRSICFTNQNNDSFVFFFKLPFQHNTICMEISLMVSEVRWFKFPCAYNENIWGAVISEPHF